MEVVILLITYQIKDVANITQIKSRTTLNVGVRVKIRKNIVCAKKYFLNLATCICKSGKYLGSITDDSVIMCDEIIEKTKSKNFSNKKYFNKKYLSKFLYFAHLIKMESNDELKEIDIENHTCYYFNDIIKIEVFDFNILIDEKPYENILFYYISYKNFIGAKPCLLGSIK